MARTYENLLSEARTMLQDTDASDYRWTDAFLLNVLNRGLQEIGRMRPDAFYDLYDANSLNIPEIVDNDAAVAPQYDWATTFQLNMQYYTPLIHFVVGTVEMQDDEFTLDGRAMTMLAQFRNSVVGL